MNVKQDFIPLTNTNRPGDYLNPTHITVHETANYSVGADAKVHALYVKGEDAQDRQVSWHYTIDDQQVIQHLPNDEVGWHAGSEANEKSIGIELCVNSDGSFSTTKDNASNLIKLLIEELNIPVENVVTHNNWTGKNCPAQLLNEWSNFINTLKSEAPPSVYGKRLMVEAESLWVYNQPDWNSKYTTVSKGEVFTLVETLFVEGYMMYKLISGLYITSNTKYVTVLD